MKISNFSLVTGLCSVEVIAGGEAVAINLRPMSSPEFHRAKAAFHRSCSNAMIAGRDLFDVVTVLDEETSEPTELYMKLECIWLSSLIESWEFEDELTQESAAALLFANPQIKELIDSKATSVLREEGAKKKHA